MAIAQQRDGRLWGIALGLSLLLNASLLVLLAFVALDPANLDHVAPPAPPENRIVILFPELASVAPAAPEKKPRFARTSPDQDALPPEKPAFMGERNTRATSDRAPEPNAPAMPSQAGIQARPDEFETTESDYQDGKISAATAKAAESPPLRPTSASPQAKASPIPIMDETLAKVRSRDALMQGPSPVDVPIPLEKPKIPDREKPEPPKATAKSEAAEREIPKIPDPTRPQDPAFKGNQRKTALFGSISRSGRSALDVADSPLGRYQAIISRAVEQEWQRNCVRHRDFITPGFLTVRFFVEPSGHVRTVQFVGKMETGEVQKGFTLNSIRNASIPAMPLAVKKELGDEPLELLFNFYF